MNKLWPILAIVALVVLLALATATAVYKPGPSDKVRTMADAYVQYANRSLPDPVAVLRIVEAPKPGNFAAQMSSASYADSAAYRTTYGLQNAASTGVLGPSEWGGSKPLPYPPQDVWCVALGPAGGAVSNVVFVVLHQDLHNADFALHELTDVSTVPSIVGCDMPIEQ